MIELFNKFQNSKLWSKLKPTEPRWVIIVLVIAVVLIAYKNLSVTPQEKTAKFVCPENYPDQATADKNNEAFIENYFKSNPDDSLTDFISYRYHTLDGARQRARRLGCEGACYAWESTAGGLDATPKVIMLKGTEAKVPVFTGTQQIQIGAVHNQNMRVQTGSRFGRNAAGSFSRHGGKFAVDKGELSRY